MSALSKHTGGRIRFHRKRRGMTIDELSHAICKSRSTVSKYERGLIVIDIDSLLDIAVALNVSISQLIDFIPEQPTAASSFIGSDAAFFFVYYYDGRNRRITRSVLETMQAESANSRPRAKFWNNIQGPTQYHNCMHLYSGHVERYDSLTRYSMVNEANPLEQVVISVLDTLSHATERVAHLTGLSINPFLPVSLKCIMSCYQLVEDDSLKERLLLSKEDFRTMRRINMFTPYSILS